VSRIAKNFRETKAARSCRIHPFITAGHPDLATTELLLIELAEAGADIIELGVPFSDPVAMAKLSDAHPNERCAIALRALSMFSLSQSCFALTYRSLLSVTSIAAAIGGPQFAGEAKRAGIDGVLVTD